MQQGIMHRDMKPQNIMLDENYNVKIIDFGDARKVDEVLDPESEESQQDGDVQGGGGPALQRRDTFVGTVNYQSPEVINGEDQGFGVDIWALGNVLFKMFTGYVPFKGTNPHTVYKDIKSRNIGWPDEEVKDQIIPLEAQDLINRMIQIDPQHRLGATLQSI
jgi:3-phosphoinositide dependent protein kinase-1